MMMVLKVFFKNTLFLSGYFILDVLSDSMADSGGGVCVCVCVCVCGGGGGGGGGGGIIGKMYVHLNMQDQ